MFEYNSKLDQYTKVENDEISKSTADDSKSGVSEPIFILKKQKPYKSKSRYITINFSNFSRIVRKSGKLNTYLIQLPNKKINYLIDLGNTLLSIQWRWLIMAVILVHFVGFLLFGMLWYVTALNSGDFERNDTNVCIINTKTLLGYTLLTVETTMTIGYGYRYPTEYCHKGWLILSMTLQSLLNIAIQGTLVSIVYVKISKPLTNISTSIFSKKAVICLRDGKLKFIFRIYDSNEKISCATNISLYFVDKTRILKNTSLGFKIVQMHVEPHGLPIFPIEIEHIIDESSPLWCFRPLEIMESEFEIIAVAEGTSTSTGQVSQNRTSYSSVDICWGHRFAPCVEYDEYRNTYKINFKNFKRTISFDTPLCSAKKLEEIRSALLLNEIK